MKVNPISVDYSTTKTKNIKRTNVSAPESVSVGIPTGMSIISFKGGNKNHVLHVVAECPPFNKAGGVATVVGDYQQLNNASATEKGKAVFVTPYYNGLVTYASDGEQAGLLKTKVELPRVPQGLPEGHPLRGHEGKPFYTKFDLSKNTVKDALESGKDFWLLEEVADKKMSWGMEKDADVKLLKVVSDSKGNKYKEDVFMIFSEANAYDPAPYSQNQYSSHEKALVRSWNGDPYAKFDKAVVECMEDISKKAGNGFDPGTVVCSDSQAAYVTHYMAQKNAEGIEFFKGKKPIQIGHNLGDGYIGKTSPRNMIVNLNIFTPEELEALTNSKALRDAIVTGGSQGEDAFFSKLLQGINAKNKSSAMSIPVHYGKNGYLTSFIGVSTGYVDEIVKNKEIAPTLYEDLIELKNLGVLKGITNPLNTTNSAFTKVGLGGYNSVQKIKLANGVEEEIQPLKMFTAADAENMTLEKCREAKRLNKINFLNRFSSKYDSAQAFNTTLNKWDSVGSGATMIRKGMGGDFAVAQSLDVEKYITKLKNGEDVKMIVSWGRGDFQKAFDETLMAFKKYVQKTGDKNTLLILGGDLNNDKTEGKKIRDLAELMCKDEQFKGRIMLLDGFAPGEPMAMIGDISSSPSRTAPCELIDFEAKKMLCTPIVSNGQGLGQKNFDPGIAVEAELADAFKTKHQYFDSRDEMLKYAKDDVKENFNKVYNKLKGDISKQYKVALKQDISPQKLEILINANQEYQDALRKLRDEVMSDEIAECFNRALNENRDNDVAKKILKNQVALQTGWENNEKVTKSSLPSGELYRQEFKKDGKTLENKDVIGKAINKSEYVPKGEAVVPASGTVNSGETKSAWTKIVNFFKSKPGKITAGATAGVAIIGGILLAGKKAGWFNKHDSAPKVDNFDYDFDEDDHDLSAIA